MWPVSLSLCVCVCELTSKGVSVSVVSWMQMRLVKELFVCVWHTPKDADSLVLTQIYLSFCASFLAEHGGYGQHQSQAAIWSPPTRELQTATDRPVSSPCLLFVLIHYIFIYVTTLYSMYLQLKCSPHTVHIRIDLLIIPVPPYIVASERIQSLICSFTCRMYTDQPQHYWMLFIMIMVTIKFFSCWPLFTTFNVVADWCICLNG